MTGTMPIISVIGRIRITLTRNRPNRRRFSVSSPISLTPSNSYSYSMRKLFALFCCVGLGACTKVIDLKVHNSSPVYVIEGNVTDEAGPYTVRVSQTVGFYAGNQYPGVSGAMVTIADGAGHKDQLTDNGDG